jgi:hypothetical protein
MKGLVDRLKEMYFHKAHTNGAVALPSPHDLGEGVESDYPSARVQWKDEREGGLDGVEAGMNEPAGGEDAVKKKRGGIGRLGKLALVGGILGVGIGVSKLCSELRERSNFLVSQYYTSDGNLLDVSDNSRPYMPGFSTIREIVRPFSDINLKTFNFFGGLPFGPRYKEFINQVYQLGEDSINLICVSFPDPVKRGNILVIHPSFVDISLESQEDFPSQVNLSLNGFPIWKFPSDSDSGTSYWTNRFDFLRPVLRVQPNYERELFSKNGVINERLGVSEFMLYLDTQELPLGVNHLQVVFKYANGWCEKYNRDIRISASPLNPIEIKLKKKCIDQINGLNQEDFERYNNADKF